MVVHNVMTGTGRSVSKLSYLKPADKDMFGVKGAKPLRCTWRQQTHVVSPTKVKGMRNSIMMHLVK